MQFFSRVGQDQFLFDNFFRGKRAGVFVDAGAGDGEKFSHSLFFERTLGWRGLCIEPDPATFARLAAARKCICEQLPVNTLPALLRKHSLFDIEYCSIDAAGAAAALLTAPDFDQFNIGVLAVADDSDVARLLAERSYEFVAQLENEGIYKRRDVRRLPRTSVICAVWHGDADRERLLEGHARNLANQTVPVESVYIFDGRDEPPADTPGHKVVVHENLSIYQAWNVGLAMVETPFVMNLNLDDRLAPDAVERLEEVLQRENAALVGGDWKVCYSQQETDAVERCYPADQLPFVGQWPPAGGTRTRLGSGTGERGTLGPATLWRMDSHIGVPRYPWRFPEGSTLKVVGDLAWWTLLTQHLKKKVVRVTDVIGHYYSHPNAQAEFRGPSNELALMGELGISLF
jgi:Glycosyl transferase family 2